MSIKKGQLEQALQYAGELLAPDQQALSQEVTITLEQVIHAWQNDQPDITRQKLELALTLAKEINQL